MMCQAKPLYSVIPPLNDCDHTQGSPTAPIVLIEYGDYQCPHSSQAYFTVKRLLQPFTADTTSDDAASGNRSPLCFVFRHFPRTQLHPQAQKAAETAEAAAAQGKFWKMHNLLFERQDAIDDGDLVQYAAELDLDVPRFLRERVHHIHAPRVQTDLNSGREHRVTNTPTFFLGMRHLGAQNLEQVLKALLEAAVPQSR